MEVDLPINWDLHDPLLERMKSNEFDGIKRHVMFVYQCHVMFVYQCHTVQCLIKMRLELKSGTQGAAENACPLIDVLATV